jgi:TonB family protein
MIVFNFRAVVCGSVLLGGMTVLAQSPSKSPASPQSGSSTDPRNAEDDSKARAHSLACSYMPNPPYTKEAKAAKFQGAVRVDVIIRPEGNLTDLRIMNPAGMGLDESVLQTLKTWKCKAAIGPEGKPLPTRVTIEINFRLTTEKH